MSKRTKYKAGRRFQLTVVALLGWALSLSSLVAQAADVRILLDVSQSMAQNDPENHRREALYQLIDSIPAGDRAAIWTFGQYTNLLVPHETVNSAWRSKARAAIQALGAPAIRTNIGGVLEKAAYDFRFSGFDDDVDVILITDGEVDIAPNSEVNRVERGRVIDQLIPLYQQANAKIHTVALSDEADHDLLRQLSDKTGGNYYRVEKPDAFVETLFNVSSTVASVSNAAKPVSTPAVNDAVNSFHVDAGIGELTVTVKHSSGAVVLVAPSGTETTAVAPAQQHWRVFAGMSQITISTPEAGTWQVKGVDASDIQHYADIELSWIKPDKSSVAEGTSVILEASVTDSRGRSMLMEMPDSLAVSMTVDGVNVPVYVTDKILRTSLPAEQSMNIREVTLTLDGSTFSRSLTRQLHAIEPYMTEVLVLENAYEWRIYSNRFLDVESIRAMASYDQAGRKVTEAFVQHDGGFWYWQLPFSKPAGQYQVALSGELVQPDMRTPLTQQSQLFTLPPRVADGMIRSHSVTTDLPLMSDAMGETAFEKEPMPVFEELQPELTVAQGANQEDRSEPEVQTQTIPVSEPVSWLTYLLLSLAGIGVLVLGYLGYRWLEYRSDLKRAEADTLIGEDELSDVGGLSGIDPDLDLDLDVPAGEAPADLDLSVPETDDPLADDPEPAPLSEAEIEAIMSENEPPPPTNTQAPNPAMEDMLDDAEPEAILGSGEPEPGPETEEEELFDISSIDDDLADLDLALDGDDPFADADETKK